MSSILRTSTAARSSRHLVGAATRSKLFAQRPAALPRPVFAAALGRRCYASGNSGNGKPGDDGKEVKKEASSAPKGMEHLYNKDSSPLSNKSSNPAESVKQEDDKIAPGHVRLTEQEEKALEDVFDMVKRGMPRSMRNDLDKARQNMKQKGIPKELRDCMKEVQEDGLSPARAAKLWRLTSQAATEQVDEIAKDPTSNIHRKTGGEQRSSSENTQQQNKSNKQEKKPLSERSFGGINMNSNFWTSVLLSFFIWTMLSPGEGQKDITWQEFRNTFLDKGVVEKLTVVNKNRVKVHLHRDAVAQMYPESPAARPNFYYYFSIGSVEAFERRLDEAQAELDIPQQDYIPISYVDETSWTSTLLSLAPILLLSAPLILLMRRSGGGGMGGSNGIFGMGRSRAKKFNHESDVKVKFSDVAGMDEAKIEIMEFVSFLKEPGVYQKLGAKIPRGAILSGPPGTGKTLLAKATAGESGVPFFSVSGSEFVEMFVGVGPSRVRDLFQNARKNTPCIIFIDEIDAIGKSRSKQNFGGGNDERESTLNQILTEMDGFNTSDQVVVLAGTNRADILDSALMRPGRFDRHIAIDRPTLEGRKQIFGVHLKNIVTHEDIENLKGRLAALTPGFAGADIANVVNEAALVAARATASSVQMKHFEQAIERVVGGLEKKSMVLSPEEKKTIAYHEAGHAICGWFFKYSDALLKVSIIPRGQALGYAQYLPGSGRDPVLLNMRQMMDRMAMTLGGRVSEELHFETVTSGASDDFNKVTRMATAMVTKWGMSSKIGYIYYPDGSESQEAQLQKPFSENTAQMIDAEVKRIVTEAYEQCKQLLVEKKKEVGLVAEELLQKEQLSREDLIRILGPRPYEDNSDFGKYFDGGASGAETGQGKNPGAIGDSDGGAAGSGSASGGAGPLPPPLGGAGGEAPAPTLFEQMKEMPRR